MDPRNDFCFKALMSDEIVRRGFIAAVLGMDEEEAEGSILLPTQLEREWEQDKLGVLDILVKQRDGTRINLEIQVIMQGVWPERTVFYSGKVFARQLKKGEPYEKLNKFIHIGILNFKLYPDSREYFSRFFLMDSKEHKLYTEKLEICILELPKVKECFCPESEVWQWGIFFNGDEEEKKMAAGKNKSIAEAYKELVRMSADEEKQLEYEAREMLMRDHISFLYSAEKKGRNEGRKEGKLEGEQRKIISFVIKMIRKGYSKEKITEILEESPELIGHIYDCYERNTGLSEDEIYRILGNYRIVDNYAEIKFPV